MRRVRALCFALVVLSGCAPSVVALDASRDLGAPVDAACGADVDCDDQDACNGAERCAAGVCVAGASASDADGDGVVGQACGGTDCDDTDADRFPGHPEVCDAQGHDEDCNADTVGMPDADAGRARCCNRHADGRPVCVP